MKRNTSLLRLSSIFMFLTGLAYLAQLAATLILHESQMFLENQAIMLASWLLIVQAVLEILCAVGGFHAAAGRRCIHRYVYLGTAVLAMAILSGVLGLALRAGHWTAATGVILEVCVPAFYLATAVVNDCTGGKWFLSVRKRHRKELFKKKPR